MITYKCRGSYLLKSYFLALLLASCTSANVRSFSLENYEEKKTEKYGVLAFAIQTKEMNKFNASLVQFQVSCKGKVSGISFNLKHELQPFEPSNPSSERWELATFELPADTYHCKTPTVKIPSITQGSIRVQSLEVEVNHFNLNREIYIKDSGFLILSTLEISTKTKIDQKFSVSVRRNSCFCSPWNQPNITVLTNPLKNKFKTMEAIVYKNNNPKNNELEMVEN